MENLFFENFFEGFKLCLSYLNWIFIIPLIVMIYLFNILACSETHALWLNWAAKLPKFVWAFIITVLWIMAFAYFFQVGQRIEIFKLIISSLATAFIYGMGIKNLLAWLTKKWNKSEVIN